MFALLYRDFVLMRKSLLLMLPIHIFISVSVPMALSGVFLMISFLATSINLGFDEQSRFLPYGMSMPLRRIDYLLAKYLPILFLGALGAVTMYIMSRLYFTQTVAISLLIATAVFSLTVLFSAILMPILIRFGLEKGRAILMVFMFSLFGLFSFIGNTMKNPDAFLTWLYSLSVPMMIAALLLVTTGLTALSFLFSLRWMQNAVER